MADDASSTPSTASSPEELFHVCHGVHAPGDFKPAGAYWRGQVAGGLAPGNDPLGELLRERVRAAKFPGKPSRQRSSFAFETLEDATFFRDHYRPGATIYRVRFADPSAPRHRVTWSAFTMEGGAPPLLQAEEFWSGAMLYSGNVEVFAESDLVFL